jgi:hypothetical protein
MSVIDNVPECRKSKVTQSYLDYLLSGMAIDSYDTTGNCKKIDGYKQVKKCDNYSSTAMVAIFR